MLMQQMSVCLRQAPKAFEVSVNSFMMCSKTPPKAPKHLMENASIGSVAQRSYAI